MVDTEAMAAQGTEAMEVVIVVMEWEAWVWAWEWEECMVMEGMV